VEFIGSGHDEVLAVGIDVIQRRRQQSANPSDGPAPGFLVRQASTPFAAASEKGSIMADALDHDHNTP
jgi:hypothetical protein